MRGVSACGRVQILMRQCNGDSFLRDFACFHETKQKREVMGRRLRLRDGRVGSAAIV